MSPDCPRRTELVELLVAVSRPDPGTPADPSDPAPADEPGGRPSEGPAPEEGEGALSDIWAHLEGCPDCRREWEEIAEIPFLLRRASLLRTDEPKPSGPPGTRAALLSPQAGGGVGSGRAGCPAGGGSGPGTVPAGDSDLASLLTTVRRRRRRRARTALAAGAVAAAVALGAVLAVGPATGGGGGIRVADTSPAGVHLDASLHPKGWGTALSVGASGLPPRSLCELLVAGAGSAEVAGWWWSAGGAVAAVPLATSLHLPQIDAVELLVDGRVVARAPLRHRS